MSHSCGTFRDVTARGNDPNNNVLFMEEMLQHLRHLKYWIYTSGFRECGIVCLKTTLSLQKSDEAAPLAVQRHASSSYHQIPPQTAAYD